MFSKPLHSITALIAIGLLVGSVMGNGLHFHKHTQVSAEAEAHPACCHHSHLPADSAHESDTDAPTPEEHDCQLCKILGQVVAPTSMESACVNATVSEPVAMDYLSVAPNHQSSANHVRGPPAPLA